MADPSEPGKFGNVHIYADGRFVADVVANENRQIEAYPGVHGFSYQLPAEYLTGAPRKIDVWGIDTQGGKNVLLSGTGKVFSNAQPIGSHDATKAGVVTGWALDPSTPASPATVHIFMDGNFVGSALANETRTIDSYPGEHGFSYRLPFEYGDGTEHVVQVWVLDTQGASNVMASTPQVARSVLGDLIDDSLDFFGNIFFAGAYNWVDDEVREVWHGAQDALKGVAGMISHPDRTVKNIGLLVKGLVNNPLETGELVLKNYWKGLTKNPLAAIGSALATSGLSALGTYAVANIPGLAAATGTLTDAGSNFLSGARKIVTGITSEFEDLTSAFVGLLETNNGDVGSLMARIYDEFSIEFGNGEGVECGLNGSGLIIPQKIGPSGLYLTRGVFRCRGPQACELQTSEAHVQSWQRCVRNAARGASLWGLVSGRQVTDAPRTRLRQLSDAFIYGLIDDELSFMLQPMLLP